MAFNAEEFVGAEPEVSEVEETVAVEEPVKAVEAAPEPVKATEKAPEPVKAEVSKVAESFLDTDDEPQGPEQQVPVHVVAELRAKNRELKEQLKTLQTPTAAGNAGAPAGIQMPDIPDDELLTGAQVKTILPRMAEQIEQRIQSRIAVATAKSTTVQSLAMARNAHADYDAVVGSAVSLGMLTDRDRAEARSSVNPAEFLFQKAQEKISLARSMFAPQTPATTPQPKPENKGADQPANPPASAQTEQERILSDDEYFNAQFGPPRQKELE